MITVSFRGVNYNIPEPNDANTQSLTDYLNALATGAVPYPTTADIDLGAAFGLKSLYYKGRNANPAASGIVRLALADLIAWRNNANNADLLLGVGGQDQLQWRGSDVTGNPMLGASTGAGQSIPNATATAIVFGTVELDTDSAYNSGTGLFTVPTGKAGHYLIASELAFNVAITGTVAIGIRKGGVLQKEGQVINPGAKQTLSASAMLNLAAGNTIDVYAFQNSGGPLVLESQAAHNFLAIKRIPA